MTLVQRDVRLLDEARVSRELLARRSAERLRRGAAYGEALSDQLVAHFPESDPQTRSSLDAALRSTSEAEAQINRAIADDRNDDNDAHQ